MIVSRIPRIKIRGGIEPDISSSLRGETADLWSAEDVIEHIIHKNAYFRQKLAFLTNY
tara:strand:- start:13 stop:186 length:174 start_codon:yes stop_codon:yes gene_type:complete